MLLLLPLAQLKDIRVGRGSFRAAVPTVVVVRAVAVFFAVGLVVLAVVAHQVLQREAVVASDEIDARERLPAAVGVEVARAGEPRGEFGNGAAVALPEAADAIAVFAVPLGPADGEIAHLISARPQIPRLGDELDLRKDGVLLDDVEERRQAIDLVQLPGERAGQIEAEPIDAHLRDPIAEAVHDELQHARLLHVERVAAAGVIHVISLVVVHQPIIRGIIDAAHRERRPEMIAFSGMVIHDVQDHFQAGGVQRTDHRFELVHRRAEGAGGDIARMRREIAQRVVSPVVHFPFIDQKAVVAVIVDRLQLDGRHAEALQVLDRRLGRQSPVGAAEILRHGGESFRKTLDVQFINQGLMPRRARRGVVAPGEGLIDDHRQRREGRAVAVVQREILLASPTR